MLVRKTQGFFNLVNVLCSAVYHDVSSDHPLTKMPISAANKINFNIIKIELIFTTGRLSKVESEERMCTIRVRFQRIFPP